MSHEQPHRPHLYEVEHERMLEHRLEHEIDARQSAMPSALVRWWGTWGYYFGILLGMIVLAPLWRSGRGAGRLTLLPVSMGLAVLALLIILIGLLCRRKVHRYDDLGHR